MPWRCIEMGTIYIISVEYGKMEANGNAATCRSGGRPARWPDAQNGPHAQRATGMMILKGIETPPVAGEEAHAGAGSKGRRQRVAQRWGDAAHRRGRAAPPRALRGPAQGPER